MPLLKLSSVLCMIPDEDDKDELYLVYNGAKIWPKRARFYRIDTDESADINLVFEVPSGLVAIQVWDFDLASKNDHLGTFYFQMEETPGEFTCAMTNNEHVSKRASYLLNWEVLPLA